MSNPSPTLPRRTLLLELLIATCAAGCYRDAYPGEPGASPEQRIIDASTSAVERMRESGRFPMLEEYLARARAVLIFPHIVKASFLLGGEGGSGVLLVRTGEGYGAPAFYSLGASSAGFQLGYQEATVLLFLMNDAAVEGVIGRAVALGTDVSLSTGTLGGAQPADSKTLSADVHQLVSTEGLFAGASLDGTVVGARESHNRAYYGDGATTRGIAMEARFDAEGTRALRAALVPR